jgi:hypothetical protein
MRNKKFIPILSTTAVVILVPIDVFADHDVQSVVSGTESPTNNLTLKSQHSNEYLPEFIKELYKAATAKCNGSLSESDKFTIRKSFYGYDWSLQRAADKLGISNNEKPGWATKFVETCKGPVQKDSESCVLSEYALRARTELVKLVGDKAVANVDSLLPRNSTTESTVYGVGDFDQ